MSDLAALPAVRLIELLRLRKCSAVEVVSACLDVIDRVEPEVKAWAYLDRDLALSEASHIDQRIAQGEHAGALIGVPIGVKDIFNTADMPTQMGSPIWKGFTPGNDARVVHYLRMAQAVIAGKTVTAEFAVHTPGPTRNPHHLEYMPGTSSSGSAAAVAAHMVPLALGTQTAGSIIRPASYCGVFGMKPSFGLIPRTGMLKTTDSLDTVGFFARTVDDLVLLLDVIRVRGRDYPLSELALGDPSSDRPKGGTWRVALVDGPKPQDAEPHARSAVQQFAQRLDDLPGVGVDRLELPSAFDEAHAIHSTIYDRALAYYFANEYKNATLVSELMYAIVERGQSTTLEQYVAALDAQAALARTFGSIAASVDVILTLSTGGEAIRGLEAPDRPDSCLIWTLCGAPAINLPLFTAPNGLPFGAQLVGRRYSDHKLLAFVKELDLAGIVPRDTFPTLGKGSERSLIAS